MRAPLMTIPLVAALLLAGCVPTTDSPSESASPTPSSTPTGSPSATPTPTSTAAGVPITVACDQLIPAQVMYDFNPNFALEPTFSPSAGSLAAEALAANGVACSWVNQSSGETIDIAAANLPADALTPRMNELVGSSNSVPTYEVEGYFRVSDGVGEAQAFDPPFWVTAVSPAFAEPGDAAPIMLAALAALR